MSTNARKTAVSKFPLRLMPSVRHVAEAYSEKEGVSLNQFINLAVAEKLVHMQHHEWLASKPVATPASMARGLAVLDRATGNIPESDDELPEGYVQVRSSAEYVKVLTKEKVPAQAATSLSRIAAAKRKRT